MMDKFRIFNKIKIDTDKYQEIETNNEELKTKMLSKINSSKTLDKWEEMFNKVFKSSLSDLKTHNETSHIYIYFYKY